MINRRKVPVIQSTAAPLDQAREILPSAITKAAEALVSCLEAEDPTFRLRAAAAILNRAGIAGACHPPYRAATRSVGGEKDRSEELSGLLGM